ncbi:hypothetical protein Tco_0710593 [Tanacetum coccineum]
MTNCQNDAKDAEQGRNKRKSDHGTLSGNYKREVEPRCSYIEGARDISVLDAMLESGTKQGASVKVKNFRQ